MYTKENFMTTFWDDFTLADRFGPRAIKDTFSRAFNEWKNDYKYLTELVIVLNWKGWEHYEKSDTTGSELYFELWSAADTYALDTLKGEELSYFLEAVD